MLVVGLVALKYAGTIKWMPEFCVYFVVFFFGSVCSCVLRLSSHTMTHVCSLVYMYLAVRLYTIIVGWSCASFSRKDRRH